MRSVQNQGVRLATISKHYVKDQKVPRQSIAGKRNQNEVGSRYQNSERG